LKELDALSCCNSGKFGFAAARSSLPTRVPLDSSTLHCSEAQVGCMKRTGQRRRSGRLTFANLRGLGLPRKVVVGLRWLRNFEQGAKCPFRNFLNRVNRLDSKEVT